MGDKGGRPSADAGVGGSRKIANCPKCGKAISVKGTIDGEVIGCPYCNVKLCFYLEGLEVGFGSAIWGPFFLELNTQNLPVDRRMRTRRVLYSLREFGHLGQGCTCGAKTTSFTCKYCFSGICERCAQANSYQCPVCCLGPLLQSQ